MLDTTPVRNRWLSASPNPFAGLFDTIKPTTRVYENILRAFIAKKTF